MFGSAHLDSGTEYLLKHLQLGPAKAHARPGRRANGTVIFYQQVRAILLRQNLGWLDFTHGVTFANAVRFVCTRYPQFWGAALLQMACFLGRNRPYLDLELDESAWRVADPEAFFATAYERILDHGLRDPIFSAHLVKTTVAVVEELPAASSSCREVLLASLNRFLHSPMKQKHVRRLARQAIALVQRDFVGN